MGQQTRQQYKILTLRLTTRPRCDVLPKGQSSQLTRIPRRKEVQKTDPLNLRRSPRCERLVPTSVGRSHSLLADREINSISLITAKINPELVGCTAVYAAHIPACRPPQRCGWTRRSGGGNIAFGGDWVRNRKSRRGSRPIEPLVSA